MITKVFMKGDTKESIADQIDAFLVENKDVEVIDVKFAISEGRHHALLTYRI